MHDNGKQPSAHAASRRQIPLGVVAVVPPLALAFCVVVARTSVIPAAVALLAAAAIAAAAWPSGRLLLGVMAPIAAFAVGIGTGYAFRTSHGSWAAVAGTSIAVVWAVAELRLRIRELRDRCSALDDELTVEHSRALATQSLGPPSAANPVARELARAARYQRTATIVIGELDNAPLLIERLGDEAVRDALLDLAELVGDDTRAYDAGVVEERGRIAWVLPETPILGARTIAERVRLRFQAAQLPGADGVAITARFGVASFPDDGRTVDELMEAATTALDDAGERGGNRTVITAAPDVPSGWLVDVDGEACAP